MKISECSNNMASPVCSRWLLRISGVVLLAFALTFSGCLSKPPLNTQTFDFSMPELSTTNGVTNGHVLGIKPLKVAPPFNDRSLVYRTGEFSYQRDPYAEFLGPPTEILFTPVSEMLCSDGGFSAVVKTGDTVEPDTIVEIHVSQLYGDIRKPGSPSAALAMQVIFMDATNGLPGKVIVQRNYSREIPVKTATAAAFMEGWNQALTEIIAEAVSDFHSQ
jgi:cholesterol transport system auxiliary component